MVPVVLRHLDPDLRRTARPRSPRSSAPTDADRPKGHRALPLHRVIPTSVQAGGQRNVDPAPRCRAMGEHLEPGRSWSWSTRRRSRPQGRPIALTAPPQVGWKRPALRCPSRSVCKIDIPQAVLAGPTCWRCSASRATLPSSGWSRRAGSDLAHVGPRDHLLTGHRPTGHQSSASRHRPRLPRMLRPRPPRRSALPDRSARSRSRCPTSTSTTGTTSPRTGRGSSTAPLD